MVHALFIQPACQVSRDVAGTIVTQQSWLMKDANITTARGFKCQVKCVSNIAGLHCCAQLPGYDITRERVAIGRGQHGG
jgi:hypothetical protein